MICFYLPSWGLACNNLCFHPNRPPLANTENGPDGQKQEES